MFWTKGPGRFIVPVTWSLFGACFLFGRLLAWRYGRPCPGTDPQAPIHVAEMACGTPHIAMIGNLNTLFGLGFLCLGFLFTGLRRKEKRRLAARAALLADVDVDADPIRVRLDRRVQETARQAASPRE
ncbi:hypothetical protein HT136_09285 [Novosphingobium profundi]|uniref:hypothetical protein n=1 Tax=Novosphingobium profundi TaxID=1774954 RepID=UPI001BDAF1BB|nr:hypothetical protein [Novosphingobium profundi]MBT0668561.1 hypothetical protein [Novosphingobium profundi]